MRSALLIALICFSGCLGAADPEPSVATTPAPTSPAASDSIALTGEAFYGFTVGEPYAAAKQRLLGMGQPVPTPTTNGQFGWEQRVRTDEGTLGIFSCISGNRPESGQQVAAVVMETSLPTQGQAIVVSVADKAEDAFGRFGEPTTEKDDLGRIQISEQEWAAPPVRATVKRERQDGQPFSTTAKLETAVPGC